MNAHKGVSEGTCSGRFTRALLALTAVLTGTVVAFPRLARAEVHSLAVSWGLPVDIADADPLPFGWGSFGWETAFMQGKSILYKEDAYSFLQMHFAGAVGLGRGIEVQLGFTLREASDTQVQPQKLSVFGDSDARLSYRYLARKRFSLAGLAGLHLYAGSAKPSRSKKVEPPDFHPDVHMSC